MVQAQQPQPGQGSPTTAPAATTPVSPCSAEQARVIGAAGARLAGWITRVTTQLGNYTSAPQAESNAGLRLSLARHFNTTDILDAEVVRLRLEAIKNDLIDSGGYLNGAECAGDGIGVAHMIGGKLPVNYGPDFFKAENPGKKGAQGALEEKQTTVLLHELTHIRLASLNLLGTTDVSYKWQRAYPLLPAHDALVNADSYTEFVREVIFGRTEAFKKETDKVAPGCRREWRRPIDRALALAQQWVVLGTNFLYDRRPDYVDLWRADRITYLNPSPEALKPGASVKLGDDTADDLDKAWSSVLGAAMELGEKMTIECPTGRGDRCPDNPYASLKPFHASLILCPAWEDRDPGDQALYLLAAVLEGRLYGPWIECWRLASLLRKFHETYEYGHRLVLATSLGITLSPP